MKRTLFLAFVLSLPALAAVRQGSTVTVGKNEVVDEDLYVAAGTVNVLGKVNGDLVVVGGTVDVQGEVTGNLLALGGRTHLAGVVDGSVRAAGGQLQLDSSVAKDVLFAGGNLELGTKAMVGRDLLALAGMATLKGPVDRNVEARAGQLVADSRIGGHLDGTVGTLRLENGAWIGSDVAVATPNPIYRGPEATLKGELRALAMPGAPPTWVVMLLGWVRAMVGLSLLAWAWRGLFPGFSQRALDALNAHPGRAAGYGAVAWLVAPALAVAAFAVGVVVGGWWLGAIALGVLGVAGLISYPLVAAALGERLLPALGVKKGPPMAAELVGLLVLTAVTLIPFVGLLVALGTALFGVGALLLALPGRWRLKSTARLDQSPREPMGTPALGSPS